MITMWVCSAYVKVPLFLFSIWYLHVSVIIRPVFGIQGSLKPTLPLPALLMDGLLIQDTFLHKAEIRSWQLVRTTEFVYGTIFLVICNPQVEKLCSHDFNRHLTPFKAEWDPKVSAIIKKCTFWILLFHNSCAQFWNGMLILCRITLKQLQLLAVT